VIVDAAGATAKIKVLRGLLPICGHCKKIRDDQGLLGADRGVHRPELRGALLPRRLPACLQKHYPEVADEPPVEPLGSRKRG
jgi:hypothetical protein